MHQMRAACVPLTETDLRSSARARDAAEAVTDGDDGAVRGEDGVALGDALRIRRFQMRRGERIGFREPCARALIEEDEVVAAIDVDLAAEVEQRLDGGRRDAALLHAGAGVLREQVHRRLLVGRLLWAGQWLRA